MTAQRLKDRIALITGASRGIGRAVAEKFAQEGAHVLLVARNRKALERVDDAIRAAGGKATLIPLELADGKSIDALGPTLYERFGRLDILVGNAGILGRLSPLTHIPSEHWERALAVNVTANWRLIRTLDPLLRRSDAGRVIFVTSGVARTRSRLLGALLRLQGRARGAGQDLCQRDRRQPDQGQPHYLRARPRPACVTRPIPARTRRRWQSRKMSPSTSLPLAMPDFTETGQIVEA